MIRHKKPTKEERQAAVQRERQVKSEAKREVQERYDVNLRDSDDSSDEEVLIRTGNVPEHWYDLYEHQGYSVKGQRVAKLPEQDELEKFVERQNDKEWWTKILDKLNNKHVRLSKADVEMIKRIRRGTYADGDVDPFDENMVFEFNETDWRMPFNAAKTPKRSFIPSKLSLIHI